MVAYISNVNHPLASLTQADVPVFLDLIQVAAKSSKKVCLILQSPGGDGDTAEKMLGLFRDTFNEDFRVIIPQYAKSAATMIAVGADRIIMSDASELGPIDPQVGVPLPSGQLQFVPAKAYVGAIDELKNKIMAEPESISAYYPILQQIKPEMIKFCEDTIASAKDFAKRWLPKGAMEGKTQPEIDATTKELIEGERYRLHGNVINHKEAHDNLKLDVEYWPMSDPRWLKLWEYYVRAISSFDQNGAKLFESTQTSTTMSIQIVPLPPHK